MTLPDSPPAVRFAATSAEYCSLIENCAHEDPRVFFLRVYQLLAKLLFEVTELPETQSDNYPAALTKIETDEYMSIVRGLKSLPWDTEYYRTLFDPWSAEGEPLQGGLSDDLSDIWRDLKGGHRALDQGDVHGAVWHWRFSFQSHWGPHHATHAMRPLFLLAFPAVDKT